LLYTGGKAPLELKLGVKAAEFVKITWNISGFDEQNVLMWIVNYRAV